MELVLQLVPQKLDNVASFFLKVIENKTGGRSTLLMFRLIMELVTTETDTSSRSRFEFLRWNIINFGGFSIRDVSAEVDF
jgi:hypothetical protein